jgi:hypothetical protein
MISLELITRIKGLLQAEGDGGTAALTVKEGQSLRIADGTGAKQANGIYIDDFSIAASSSTTIDLSGSLEDRLGNPLVFTAVKAIMVIAAAANTNDIVIGDGSAPFVGPFDDGTATVSVAPGGQFMVANPSAAGWAVTATTADELKLANSGSASAVAGTIVIVGEVA